MVRAAVVSGLLVTASYALGAQRGPDARSLGPLSTSAIYEQVSDSVVRICPEPEEFVGCGSGVIINVSDNRGTIATNAHVMDGADAPHVTLSNGNVHEVQGALAMHAAVDIMLITIEAPNLKAARRDDSESLTVGQEVVVVSSPGGFLNTVSESIISGCRTMTSVNSDWQFATDRYQIDGGTAGGSSGGGVFNRAGALVGLGVEGIRGMPDVDFIVPLPFVQWLDDNKRDRPISVTQARRLQDLYQAGLQIMATLNTMGGAASSQADVAEQALNAVELNFRDPKFDEILEHEIHLLRQVAGLSSDARELQRNALLDWVPSPLQPGAICAGLSPGSPQG